MMRLQRAGLPGEQKSLEGDDIMSEMQKNTDVNRTVDGDTAEGHIRVTIDEAELRAGKRQEKRVPAIDDDEAEGHIRVTMEDAEIRAGKRQEKRVPAIDDDEAEGHGVLKAR